MKMKNEVMDEVALVASDQQKFQKSIKGIKKLIKSGKIAPRTDEDARTAKRAARSYLRREKRPKKEKGLVYISHIPHGFYENEMTQYFRQFGVVTNVRVLRSRKTGRSKGAAFVEFLEPAVAEIVADTMNNYLMGKRLLKAALVPPEKQRSKAFRKNWNTIDNPSGDYRRKIKKVYNENGSDSDDLKLAQKHLKLISRTKRKLKELGIDYDFFQPVDVPEKLLQTLNSSSQNEISSKSLKKEKSPTLVSKKADKPQKEIRKVQKINEKVKKEQTKDVNVRNNEKVEQNNKVERKKSDIKKPKFEGQDFIKVAEEKKSKKNKKQEQSVEDSDDTNEEFDSDAFDELSDSDEFQSGEQSDDESGDEDEPSNEDDDDDQSLEIGIVNSSEDELKVKETSKKKKKPAPIQNGKNAGSKSAQPAKQNGGKRKLVAIPAPLKKTKIDGGNQRAHNQSSKNKKNRHGK